MARPIKDALLYFPFDTDFFSNTKIRVLRGRYGTDGISVYLYLLCAIYSKGYFTVYNDDLILIISSDLNISEKNVRLIVSFLLSRSLLVEIKDSTLAKSDTVLTAYSIQECFQEAKKGLKRKVMVNPKYWLLSKEKTLDFIVFEESKSENNLDKSEKNPDKSEKNPDKSENNSTKKSKVKKSKENKSKENNTPPFVPAELRETWSAFVEHRKKLKKPMSDYSKKLNYDELMKLSDGDFEKAKRIIEQSVKKGWQGFFELEERNNLYGNKRGGTVKKPTEFKYGETLGD